MPKCYQLIGVPCAGKSTWYNSQEFLDDAVCVSTDHFVEREAKRLGKTYSEIFNDYMPTAVNFMADLVITTRNMCMDIVWDQTSTTVKSRTRKFNMLPGYDHIAVVFTTPAIEVLKERLASRPGKEIPWEVVQGMIDNFEMPTEEEGFKEIWRV